MVFNLEVSSYQGDQKKECTKKLDSKLIYNRILGKKVVS